MWHARLIKCRSLGDVPAGETFSASSWGSAQPFGLSLSFEWWCKSICTIHHIPPHPTPPHPIPPPSHPITSMLHNLHTYIIYIIIYIYNYIYRYIHCMQFHEWSYMYSIYIYILILHIWYPYITLDLSHPAAQLRSTGMWGGRVPGWGAVRTSSSWEITPVSLILYRLIYWKYVWVSCFFTNC